MFLTRWLNSRAHNASPTSRRTFRPRLEALDGRDLPSTLMVLNAADSGPGSLRDAVAAAHSGDTITFDKSLTYQTIGLSGQIVLDKSLDIEGLSVNGNPGVFILDSAGRAFDVQSGANVVLANLGAGGSADRGGAILNEGGTVSASNCSFGGNALSGGAIYNAGGALSLSKCVFAGLAQSGGAIYNAAGSVSVAAGRFNGTLARGAFAQFGGPGGAALGGAIYNADGAMLSVSNSDFNTAEADGGNVVGGPGRGGDAAGGAIYSAGGPVSVSNTTFERCNAVPGWNIATGGEPAFVGRATGGAVYAGGGMLTLVGCTFTGNLTGDSGFGCLPQFGAGGAVYLAGGATSVASCEFLENGAVGASFAAGGAIYQGGGSLSIRNTDFWSNGVEVVLTDGVAPDGAFGGAVYIASGTTTVQNCSFNGNAAYDFYGTGVTARGGAIFNAGGDLTVSRNTTFAGDFASTADPDISGPYVLK